MIESNEHDVRKIENALAEADLFSFDIKNRQSLGDSLAYLEHNQVDIVVLDIFLPDNKDMKAIGRILEVDDRAPIIILSSTTDPKIYRRAVVSGAQDCLLKNDTIYKLVLPRSIQYAIERNVIQMSLNLLSHYDDMTGLNNRRGFMTQAQKKIFVSRKNKQRLNLVFIDLDNLKQINDRLGHNTGDEAIIRAAHFLQNFFSDDDVVARFGGDEFVVLAGELGPEEQILSDIETKLAAENRYFQADYELSLTAGISSIDPESDEASLETMLEVADKKLYQNKLAKKTN